MGEVPDTTTSSPTKVAWGLLQAGQWEAARACFEGAIDAGETPAALEGLSWAVWWLDDAATCLAARERAYLLYKGTGDLPGAARMAIWLASDELDFRGAAAVASGWLRRAHRLIDPLEERPEHGWLAFLEGYLALGSGEGDRAAELGRRAVELGHRFDVPDLEMLGLSVEGAALVAAANLPDGMARLDEATASAMEGQAQIPISGAWACCFLVSACIAVRDYERAAEWCDRIADFAKRYGSRYMLAFCRAEYGAVDVWRGRWADAEGLLSASIDDFSQSRPPMVAGPIVGLAELRRRQGRAPEAAGLLDRAGPSSAEQLCRARLALDRGQHAEAAELAERTLRQVPAGNRLDQVPALELIVRARSACGNLTEARKAVVALRVVEDAVGTAQLRASVDLADGLLAAAEGDHDRARRLIEDAVDGFDRGGARYDAATTRMDLASVLRLLSRADAAARETAIARDQLRRLGVVTDEADWQADLTPREREVLDLVTEGLTNRQIGEQLVVSEHTVHRHVTNVLRKLGLPSRTAAAALAARHGVPKEPSG